MKELSQEFGFKIIEDACHAFGNFYHVARLLDHVYTLMLLFSFHALKTISCGEGGLLTTKSTSLHQKALRFSTLALLRGTEKEPWGISVTST